jgi:hypothetical protein
LLLGHRNVGTDSKQRRHRSFHYSDEERRDYLDAGWDLVGRQEDGTSEIWQVADGNYPVLAAAAGYEPVNLQGRGTPADPYLIFTPTDLGAVVHDAGACYRLACDLDLVDIKWSTAAIPVFWGTFDGDHHCIRNLTIDGRGHVGLFGTLFGQDGVWSLSIVDSSVVGSGRYVGGLAAVVYRAMLTDCCYIGRVAGGAINSGRLGWREHDRRRNELFQRR